MDNSLIPEPLRITPTELTISEFPTNKKDIPINKAFRDFIVRFGLGIAYPYDFSFIKLDSILIKNIDLISSEILAVQK